MWASSEVEQHLRDQYKGKTLVLRNFYHGDHLRYASSGLLDGYDQQGDWTTDGFVRVTGLEVSRQRLTIEAERLFLGNTGQSFLVQQYFDKDKKKKEKDEKERKLRIEVELDADGISSKKADAALSRIFLTALDRLPELVPDYWGPCVLAASTGKSPEPAVGAAGSSQNWRTLATGGKQSDACGFPPGFAAIPRVVYSSEIQKADEAGVVGVKAEESPIFRVGKGVSAPKPISQKGPEFSDEARSAKYQGTVVLSIVVDKTGQTRNIRIRKPVGFGLDQKAVETVSTWRFKPATKDGEPIDVELAVEVDFHLY